MAAVGHLRFFPPRTSEGKVGQKEKAGTGAADDCRRWTAGHGGRWQEKATALAPRLARLRRHSFRRAATIAPGGRDPPCRSDVSTVDRQAEAEERYEQEEAPHELAKGREVLALHPEPDGQHHCHHIAHCEEDPPRRHERFTCAHFPPDVLRRAEMARFVQRHSASRPELLFAQLLEHGIQIKTKPRREFLAGLLHLCHDRIVLHGPRMRAVPSVLRFMPQADDDDARAAAHHACHALTR